MKTAVHTWREGIATLRTQWIELVTAHNLNPSLHPDWLDITLGSHNLTDQALIVSVQDGSNTLAIVPLLPRKISVAGMPLRCLDLCSNTVSYHAGLIAGGNQGGVLEAVLREAALPRWDVLRMENVVSDGATARAAEQIGAARVLSYPGERSPYVQMGDDWTRYLASLSKKVRANIKRCIAMTQQAGETGMKWYERDSDPQALLADILEVESRSWKASEAKAIRAEAAEGAYYQRLLPWLNQNGLLANVLYIKERPAAYVLCARWQGWVGQLKTSFAQEVRDAGFRVIHASLERAYGTGEREYDFLGDVAPHKTRWTELIRPHEGKWLFADHWRGRALLRFKDAVDGWRRRRAKSAPAEIEAEAPPQ